MGRKKDMTPGRQKKRIMVLLAIGVPLYLLVYTYFIFRDQGKFDDTALVTVPDQIVNTCVDWCTGKWDELTGSYFAEEEVEGAPGEAFAPGSAGQLGKSPKMYGMEVPLEQHRKLVLESTKGGTLSIPDESSEEVTEEAEE
jgi:putative intracellular protease/amidase